MNVSRKKSRASIAALARPCRGRRSSQWKAISAAGQSDAGSAWATEPPIVPQLRTCGSPMPAGQFLDHRIVVADDHVLVDLAMRRPGADPQVVVGLDDPVEPADRLEVDQHPGLAEAELQQRDQAVAAGEELGLALSLVQDPDRLVEARRPYVLERSRNHRATVLLHPCGVRLLPACPLWRAYRGDDRAVGRTGSGGLGVVRPGSALSRYEYALAVVSASTNCAVPLNLGTLSISGIAVRRLGCRAGQAVATDTRRFPMGTQVVHVEVTGKDGAKLQQFFKDVFGWSLDTNNPGGYGMYRQDDGLTGGIGAAQDGGPGGVTFYVHTDDPKATLDKAEAAGGQDPDAADRGRARDDDRPVRRSRGARHRDHVVPIDVRRPGPRCGPGLR